MITRDSVAPRYRTGHGTFLAVLESLCDDYGKPDCWRLVSLSVDGQALNQSPLAPAFETNKFAAVPKAQTFEASADDLASVPSPDAEGARLDFEAADSHRIPVRVTDSGGLQKEAFALGVPCLTVREETEWVETVKAGWNRLVGTNPGEILLGITDFRPMGSRPWPYGRGKPSEKIRDLLIELIYSGREDSR